MNTNTNFEQYLEKYCHDHEITPKEALKHKTVQDVKAYYEESEKGCVNDDKK